jgi:glucosamine--fructose-6-phosphate aminotransferase (isomerizing)
VSYIHAEGFAAGELKHGVIALIEKGTPVIIFNPDDETYEDTLSSAYEVKARGAHVIGISSKKNSVFDEFIPVDSCGEATIIPNVVVAQLMGYYLALAKGYDPDKPRNLAKSVTVK